MNIPQYADWPKEMQRRFLNWHNKFNPGMAPGYETEDIWWLWQTEVTHLRKGLERVVRMCEYEGKPIDVYGIPAVHRSALRTLEEDLNNG